MRSTAWTIIVGLSVGISFPGLMLGKWITGGGNTELFLEGFITLFHGFLATVFFVIVGSILWWVSGNWYVVLVTYLSSQVIFAFVTWFRNRQYN